MEIRYTYLKGDEQKVLIFGIVICFIPRDKEHKTDLNEKGVGGAR